MASSTTPYDITSYTPRDLIRDIVSNDPDPETVPEAVRIPITEVNEENLMKLIQAKEDLICKALGLPYITITFDSNGVEFPWFYNTDEAETRAITHFIKALCKLSVEAKRVSMTAKPINNDKYAFRCFLLRLGFIGSEYKEERKILLKNLSGSPAFKNRGTKNA